MTHPVKLEGPPSEAVEWLVEFLSQGERRFVTTVARTAWLAHVQVCPQLPGNPAFGSCRVWRAQ
jgi:hypothetical protein